MPGGRPRKSLEQHVLDGTYRPSIHGPLPPELEKFHGVADLPSKPMTKIDQAGEPPPVTRSHVIDPITRNWIRNAADEKAANDGMRFDEERGLFVVDWIQRFCRLYQGAQFAGKNFVLLPYQRDFVMRLFGWVRWSPHFARWIRRFASASLWCGKKNGKTPLFAAIGLHLTCSDGEVGNNVYVGATNGKQAKIPQKHSCEMVKASPELLKCCKVHETTMTISHGPSKSVMEVVTGDDARGTKSKEGFNGSVFVDELHVVDREMMERLSRAGISRMEPLNVTISTAGDDPSSYGHERLVYGQEVNNGDRDDSSFLHVEYSAPQKLTDAEIEERLEELGQMANPAWGHIVRPAEFYEDFKRCKGKPREMARFKQYRLNIWVGSTNPWLNTTGWEKGKIDFEPSELAGKDCFIGLDLSRTRDMTSCSFVFPWDDAKAELPRLKKPVRREDEEEQSDEGEFEVVEAIRVWPMMWLPEQVAKERDKLFPFMGWASAGFLNLTRGEVVDYDAVVEDIVAFAEEHELNVLGIYFDRRYANEITRRLAARLGMHEDDDRFDVPQNVPTLSPIAMELERRVQVGLVQHPGNPVLTWQVGHVEVSCDRNRNIYPRKPDPASGKSVDGVFSILDGMAGLATYKREESEAGGCEAW